MANTTIDTTSPQDQQLLNGLGTLRTVLTPRAKVLRGLSREQQRWWVNRDPLMKEFVRMVRDFNKLAGIDA